MNCLKNQEKVKALFASCDSEESKYKKIIELGRGLGHLSTGEKCEENLVKGCQSRMYLFSKMKDGLLFFEAESDALISAGLAYLLIEVYSGEKPEIILTTPPTYLEELGIGDSLTPNRASGLYSIHLRMKQEALKQLSSL